MPTNGSDLSTRTENDTFSDRLAQLVGSNEPYSWAKELGIASATFGRMWNENHLPKVETLLKICRVHDVSLDWLVTGHAPDLEAVQADLDYIDARLTDGDPTPEECETFRRKAEPISSREDLPQKLRGRADMILGFLGDGEAERRQHSRIERVAAHLGAGAHAYDRAVREIGFTPPTMTGMILRNSVMSGTVSEDKLREILSAMKYDAETGE